MLIKWTTFLYRLELWPTDVSNTFSEAPSMNIETSIDELFHFFNTTEFDTLNYLAFTSHNILQIWQIFHQIKIIKWRHIPRGDQNDVITIEQGFTLFSIITLCYNVPVLKGAFGQGILNGEVPLTSCLTGLDSAVWQLIIFVFIRKTGASKPVKQEVNGTVILPPLVFPASGNHPSQPGWIKVTGLVFREFYHEGGQGVLSFPSAIFHCVNSFDSIDNEIPGECTVKLFRVVIIFRSVVNG
jgi:hypothetical protein